MKTSRMLAVGALAATLLASPAIARCVRDVAPSGAVSVRCADGVRGYLPSDDVAPPVPGVEHHTPDWMRNSRAGGDYAAPVATPSPYSYQSGDLARRPADAAAGALSHGTSAGDHRPY